MHDDAGAQDTVGMVSGETESQRISLKQRGCAGRGVTLAASCVVISLLVSVPLVLWSIRRPWAYPQPETVGLGFDTSDFDAGPSCAPTQLKGLPFCPQLTGLLPTLLENKRTLLRLVLDAVTGRSCDPGPSIVRWPPGRPDSAMMEK